MEISLKRIGRAVVVCSLVGLVPLTIVAEQREAARRAVAMFTTEECETGHRFRDSEAFLKGASSSTISAAREDWTAFGIRARVVGSDDDRYRTLLVSGSYGWSFTIEEPYSQYCRLVSGKLK